MIKFEPQDLEVMKKSGQVVGHVGNSYISEIYQLDRARTVEDFEKQIKNIALRAISIGKKEEESIYTKPLVGAARKEPNMPAAGAYYDGSRRNTASNARHGGELS